MQTSPKEDFADSGDEDDKDVTDQFKELIRLSRNTKQNYRNFAKTEFSNQMNWGQSSGGSQKESKIMDMLNLVLKRLMSGKFVTQIRPHFLSAILNLSDDEADCISVANILYSRITESISKTSRSQTIVLNGRTTMKRVKTTLMLLNQLCKFTIDSKEKTSITSEQLSLFYKFASTTNAHGFYLKPLFAFNIGITFKTEKGSTQLIPLDFDFSASCFNRFEIEYLIEKKSPYQTAVQCIVEKFEIFKDILCAPSKMLEPLLGQTFVGLKYFSFIKNLKNDIQTPETRFYDFLKNVKRALLCTTREINTLLRTLSLILLLLDLEDNTSSDAFNEAIKSEIEGHLETFDPDLLGHVCEILHMEQDDVLKSAGLMVNNNREELGFAFTKCTSFVCVLMDSLFRWIEQKCRKASSSFINSLDISEDIDSESIAAVQLISFPEIVPDRGAIHSFGDLWCNASAEHAYSWALQYLVEDISTSHVKEGFVVTDPLMDILEGSPCREIIDFLFGGTGLLCSYPSLSEISSFEERKDAVEKVIHFFRNNSYYGLSSVNTDPNDLNCYVIGHSFGPFKYEVGSFFPKYINKDVQHQILKSGIPSVEISDLHKEFLHSMKKLFSPTSLNSNPTFVTFFSISQDGSNNDLAQQMIHSQIMTVSEVSEKSFDITLSKKSFWKVFHPLSYRRFSKDIALDHAVSKILLHNIGPQKSGSSLLYFIGKTSVMMKRSSYEVLRENTFETMNEASVIIQRQWRHHILRKKTRESMKSHFKGQNFQSLDEADVVPSNINNSRMGLSTTPVSEKKKKLQKSYAYSIVKRKEAFKKRAMSPAKKKKQPQKIEKFNGHQSVSIIQALIRGKLVSSQHTKKVDFCLKIQKLYREKKRRDIETEIRKRKINVIKKRNEQKKHEMEKVNKAARKIQQAWINYKEIYLQKQLIEAIIIIQRAWRAYKLKRSLKILLKIRRESERKRKEFEERERRLRDKELQVTRDVQELEHQKRILFQKEKLFSKQQLADKKFKEKEEEVWNSLQEISNSLIHSNNNITQQSMGAPQPPSFSRIFQIPDPPQKKQIPKDGSTTEKPKTDLSSNQKRISYEDLLKETYGSAFEQRPKKPVIKKVNKTEPEIDTPKISSSELNQKKVSSPQNKSTIITNITKQVVSKQTERKNLNTSKYQPNTVIVPENSLKELIERNERKLKKPNETWNHWNMLVKELSNEFEPKC